MNLKIALGSIVIFTTLISFNSRTWHSFLSVCFIFAFFHHTACLTAYMCFVCLGRFIPSYWRRKWQPTPVLLPGKSHGWRSLIGYSPWGPKESDTTERLHFHISLSCIGEGSGNPLQCSCLENPRDGGAWWAPIYGVAQSQTRLMRLSSSSIPSYGIPLVAVGNGTVSLVSLSDFSCCAISMQRISVYSFCILGFTKFID